MCDHVDLQREHLEVEGVKGEIGVKELYLKIKKYKHVFSFHVVFHNIIAIKTPSFSIYSVVGQEPNTLVHSSCEFG